MYNFAICDSSCDQIYRISSILDLYRNLHCDFKFTVESFASTQALLDSIMLGSCFDLLLMNTNMPEKTGMEVAHELRSGGYRSPILLLSSSGEYALEAFDLQPVHYIITPVSQDKLFATIDLLCSYLASTRQKFIVLKTEGELRRIALQDIVYCESHSNNQFITLAGQNCICTRMTVADLFRQLSHCSSFVRCGVAYIVNLDHVVRIATKEIMLDNGSRVPVPRGSYTPLKKEYFSYYSK